VVTDPVKKAEYTNKLNNALSFAESIDKKIKGDPNKYDIQKAYYAKFNEFE